jgi:hypothetical protein
MNTKSMIRCLNLADGEVLTLEKATDRMEFEALPVMDMQKSSCTGGANCECLAAANCPCNTGGNCWINI